MIDIYNQIYTALDGLLSVHMSGTLQLNPSEFPAVSMEEIDNVVDESYTDSARVENIATITYEFNIWSNSGTKKTECKNILATIDNYMSAKGFTRTMANPIATSDPTLYRIVARYRARVSTNETIYRG